ncbi:MAG: hypothetical protein Kow00124_24650 [Anaerolineae bacterium]
MSRILVVDDDISMLRLISLQIEKEGYQVRATPDPVEALEMARVWRPDLILLDVMMPEMDGFELCRRLREVPATAITPIIMLTAKTALQDKAVGFDSGADDYITKPYQGAELRMRINAHLRRAAMTPVTERLIPVREISVPLALRTQRSGVFKRWYQISKRLFDVVSSSVALLLLLPLMLLIALAIRIDSPGPVLFKHRRVGLNGKPFYMYKFRTMFRDADKMKEQLLHLNEMEWPAFKITNDPRVTRVGRFLRKTSLDELPQLFNVVKGDMSLVGPRPHSWGLDTYQLWQTERLEVLPGVTGLWQVSGRNDITSFADWVELDIEYIERQSWEMDLTILWMTITSVLAGRGAY